MDYHRRLADLLRELRAARTRNDGPAVEAAYVKLAAHAESLEMLVHFLHDCREKWGANLELDEVVTWLAGEYRSGVRRLYPAVWDHLSADIVFAEMERWLARASEPGAENEPLSKPLSRSEIMRALGIDGPKRFKSWAEGKLRPVKDNRQLVQVYLNRCAPNERAKIEKA